MPKLTKAERDRLPSTLTRSEAHAQAVYAETLESAEHVEGHEGDAQYSHRVAFGALKHSYEKVGDHWEPKGHRGPSDSQSASGGAHPDGTSAGGVDANAGKAHLLGLARRADIAGRSTMTKAQLVAALQKSNGQATKAARDT